MVQKHTQTMTDKLTWINMEADLLLRLINDPDDDDARATLNHLQSLKNLLSEKERLERCKPIEDEER